MNPMIERMARALCVADGHDPDFNYDPKGIVRTDDIRWRLYAIKARAAIAAMREPTDEMLLAGFLADELDNLAGGEGHEPVLASYHAMIDEALKVPA